jgi:hypothetical protein
MINITFEIEKYDTTEYTNDGTPTLPCHLDYLFTGVLEFKVGDIDYGSSTYLLTFFSNMFMMLLDCLCFGKHVVGGTLTGIGDISLRLSDSKGKMFIGNDNDGKILNEQEVFIDDLTMALGKAYRQFVKDSAELYPELKDVLKFRKQLVVGMTDKT